jgi:4-hydroxy-tetrahydrodipicolinate reductase
MSIRVCLAGATGWAGSALAKAIHEDREMQLVGAVSRTHAGKPLGDALGTHEISLPVSHSAEEALTTTCDVFVEYTQPDIAKQNILLAIAAGAHVVVGTSGLADADYFEIDEISKARGVGVLACGNFALTVVLLQKFAEMAAKHIPHWEILDYAHSGKKESIPWGMPDNWCCWVCFWSYGSWIHLSFVVPHFFQITSR